MKYIRRFNENINSCKPCEDILAFVKSEFTDFDLESIKYGENSISFEMDHCPVEPEQGSYCHRTHINFEFKVIGDVYEVRLCGISGEYGSDEEEEGEESDFDVEFDWQVSASRVKLNKKSKDLEEIKSAIKKEIESVS